MRALKPKISERVNPAGSISFCVDAGRINGRRHRKFFATEKEARIYARKITKAKQNQGALAFTLSSRQQIEAVEVFKRLEATKTSLTDAINFYFRHNCPKGGVKTVQQVTTELLEDRRTNGAKPRYLVQLKCDLDKFCTDFGETHINEIFQPQVKEWLGKLIVAPITKINYIRDLTTLFNFAVSQKYCVENPLAEIKKPKLIEKPTEIYTVPQALRLLFAAYAFPKYELLPYIAIGFFAGLRSSELELLDWAEINLSQRFIEVKAENAKSSRRRIVKISDNLHAWLKPHEQMDGLIAPANWRKKFNELTKLMEFEKLPKNGLRHSFGSYHLAKHQNAHETSLQMGHESPKMLFRHYRELVQPKDAEDYWNLYPPKNGWAMIPPRSESKKQMGEDEISKAKKLIAELEKTLSVAPMQKAA